MDFELRLLTLIVFVLWQGYWKITERKADREKPKKQLSSKYQYVKKYGLHYFVYTILFFQLLGWSLFPVNFRSQEIGIAFVILGMLISVSGRRVLGTNWSHAAEYQIKQKQTLVTTGIYSYIRNPIYTGLWLAITGAELVAKSNLFIVLFAVGFFIAYKQAKLEEGILEAHFGKEYLAYKKRSKMLIPFLF